jgi:microtubule-associated serine/threonine kinase
MAVSPLERDTTLKAEQQSSHSSSTLSPIHSIKNNLRPPIIIHRGPRSFGFTLRAVKVFHGNTDYYTTQHVVVAVQGPAEEAGLRPNDVITHVNDHPVAGLMHSEVVKLILSGSQKLSIRAIPSSETQIRTGGRRRSPSKQKLRYQHPSEKKSSTNCPKHRINSGGNNTLTTNGNNSNKKHQQNTSLFRRLSERKVARDIEAAAAAGVSLPVPTTCVNTNTINNPMTTTTTTTTITTTNTNALSSSLPLLSFSQLTLDPAEWPPLKSPALSPGESDSPQPTSLPMIVKQKSQV